ncbi:deoxyribonuclease-1-like [Seriola dumerili]|uniref:Deoxyribonuclease n=1 Tax=Seriola dumerili TaxID=41447 RepID=A0A3B4U569_SERDU|nr:deoxyribonuclease-1-like [Seriola dumerili]
MKGDCSLQTLSHSLSALCCSSTLFTFSQVKMKIASFNVKKLGLSKVNDDFVRTYLIKIVSRYSVVVMLEVVDANGRAMKKFLEKLNEYRDNRHDPFSMESSKMLGRSTYKEKFVFFYRAREVKLIDSFQYEEEGRDVFAREPFAVQFKCLNTAVKKLVLIAVHSKPEDAETELNALGDVVEAVRNKFKATNIMILGDFNADGPYLSNRKKENSPMWYPPYFWLIDDKVDTTTSNKNDHTYDRIVVFGNHMYEAVGANSAKAFNFQRAYHLPDAAAQAISDHYPVEVELL